MGFGFWFRVWIIGDWVGVGVGAGVGVVGVGVGIRVWVWVWVWVGVRGGAGFEGRGLVPSRSPTLKQPTSTSGYQLPSPHVVEVRLVDRPGSGFGFGFGVRVRVGIRVKRSGWSTGHGSRRANQP